MPRSTVLAYGNWIRMPNGAGLRGGQSLQEPEACKSWLGLESKKPWVSGCIDCQASIARCYPLPTIVDDSISRIIFKAP